MDAAEWSARRWEMMPVRRTESQALGVGGLDVDAPERVWQQLDRR
jgi:hypothetical protein